MTHQEELGKLSMSELICPKCKGIHPWACPKEKDKELLQLRAQLAEMRAALSQAMGLIETEYCSHPDKHGPNNTGCYADFLYKALSSSGQEWSEAMDAAEKAMQLAIDAFGPFPQELVEALSKIRKLRGRE